VCDSLGVEPDADIEEDALENSFMHWVTALGGLIRERVQGALHHGVKRAMAVESDRSKTEKENEAACLGLIEAAEESGGRLARLFEDEMLLPADDEGL
jgi:hypothetical protein